jgi:DNA-binding MarR family transcriptional regulator
VLRVLLANVDVATSSITVSQSHLAKQPEGGNLSKTRFSRALKRLERAGIIYFSRSAGRRATIVLTELGLGVYGISPEEWCAAGGVLRGRDSRI